MKLNKKVIFFFAIINFFSSSVFAQFSVPSLPSVGVNIPGVGGVSAGVDGVSVGVGNIDYFGGKIVSTIICTCSDGIYLEIEDYVTGSIIKTMYLASVSTFYQFYNLTPGVYTLGGFYNVGMVCAVRSSGSCVTEAVADSIIDNTRGIGTSPY